MATQSRGSLSFWIASAWIMAGTSASLALWGSGEEDQSPLAPEVEPMSA